MALSRESIRRDYPWITKDFLQSILRKKFEKPSLEVTEFEAIPATSPGENYATVVIRVQMKLKNFESESFNAVFKVNHASEDIAEIMGEYDLNSKEIHLYEVVLKQVHELLRNVGINVKLGAELISHSNNPPYVMFEDLKPLGFKIVDKYKGLDCDHLKMTLTKLAYWHAGTAILGEKDPSTVEMFLKCLQVDEIGAFDKLIQMLFHRFGTEAEKWEGFEEIGKKFQELSKIIYERGAQVVRSDPNTFNVLNHGDLWLCNIMYKHNPNTEKLEDIINVDYSVSYWGKPGLDLSYFLFSSSAEDITEEDWDNLLLHYYSVLTSTLKKLNYQKEIPRYFDIYINFLHVGQFSCGLALLIASIRQLVDGSQGQISNLLKDSTEAAKFRETLTTNPNFKISAKRLLKYYHRKGLLD